MELQFYKLKKDGEDGQNINEQKSFQFTKIIDVLLIGNGTYRKTNLILMNAPKLKRLVATDN